MIPNTVWIGGLGYNVEYDDKLNDGSSMLYGQNDYDEAAIRLNNRAGMSKQMLELTLWHEILHGIFLHFNKAEWRNDEELVDTVARGIYMVLADNPGLSEHNA